MNNALTPTRAIEIFDAIKSDACYHATDHYGQRQLFQSKDINDQSMLRLIAEHAFVEQVSKTTYLAFEFEKSFAGPEVKKTSPLASRFFELALLKKGDTPPKHEISEESKLLSMVANTLGFGIVQWTGNPLSVISNNVMLEGEFINTLISRLRTATKQNHYKTIAQGKRDANSKLKSDFKRYESRIFANDPYYHVLRFDLGCVQGNSDPAFIRESLNYIQTLTDMFGSEFSSSIAGYWWKREFLSEIGYRYHLIIFSPFNAKYNPNALIEIMGERWNDVTNGRGKWNCYNYDNGYSLNHRTWGIGPISYQGKRDALLRSVKLMIEIETYLSLSPVQPFEHFGMGKLPKKISLSKDGSIDLEQRNFGDSTSKPTLWKRHFYLPSDPSGLI